jgi:dCTP deaminase
MTILSGKTLIKMASDGSPIVTPFLFKSVKINGMSAGVSHAGYDIRVAQDLWIWPLGFALASTVERFQMQRWVIGVVHDKSTWARLGIAVQNTILEPGWAGHLTLEISNNRLWPRRIRAGSPIAQVIFHRLDEAVDGYKGKYSDQPARPVAAILEE